MLDSSSPGSIAAQSRSTPTRPASSNWFKNLSIGRKQLIALLVCELIPILGLGIGSTIVLTNSLRTQLLSQAKSEVAVTETNYNIKINQMGFGSRGQSDNPAILTAAKNYQRNENLAPDLQNQTDTIAAETVPNRIVETLDESTPTIVENAPAALVRETSELALNQSMLSSLQQEAIVLVLASAAILVWTTIFRRTVLKPIQELRQTTEAFANGDRNARAQISARNEVGQLAIAFNRMADSINASEESLASELARQEQQMREIRALNEITTRMRRSLNPAQILQTAIDEARTLLKIDRVLVYQFTPGTVDGTVIAESIGDQNLSVIQKEIEAPLSLDRFEQYSTQSAWVIKDVAQEMNDRYRQQLATFNTKAEIAVPLKQENQVIGFICAQTCQQARDWQSSEITFFTQLVIQIGYALAQSKLLQERQTALQDAETRKSSIQQQIIQLLGEIQNVSAGDLTVRANVNGNDLGTIADFFNAVVASLRNLVFKVKQTSAQVSDLISQNEDEMKHLADQARQQAQETTRTLDSVEQMTLSMQSVAERAQQAAIVAQNATNAAKSGESVMDSTVTSIYSLRATVEDATRKVKQLGESSQHIGRVVSLINDLATQTDLLAINASIEATRAGDHGRGFGIVANEIGELASRSATATREIAALIETTQQQITEVVEAMNRGATQVVEGAHLARNAKQSLIHVVQVSEQMDNLIHSISEAMVSQANTSQSVTDLIKEVAQVSTLTSDSSVRVSKALRQTVDVAEELQSSVGMFKVQMGDRR